MSNLLEKASIATTPTAYENGKILSVKPSVVLGSELITNGNFVTNLDGWILSTSTPPVWDNGMMKMASDGATFSRADQSFVTKIGAKYKFEINKLINNHNILVKIGDGIGNSNVFNQTLSSIDEYTFTITATSTTSYIRLEDGSGTDGGYVSNISVKEAIDGDFDFTRNSSATRVNSEGLIEDVQILSSNLVSNGDFSQEGSELITNGDFATDSDWNKINSTISGSAGNLNGTGVTSMLYQNILTNGKTYKVTFTVSDYNSLGEARIIESSGSAIYTITSNGTFTFTFTHSNADGNFLFRARTGAVFSIDNVSVKEVGQDWSFVNADISIGNNGLEIISQGGNRPQANQIISGLTVGNKYKLSAIAKRGTCVSSVEIEISGIGSTVTTNQNNTTEFANIFYEFTATSTSHTIQAKIDDGASTIGETAFFKSVSVIEITEDTNLPRIDYTGGEGHWLFEPQSTNLLDYSNDFSQSYWTKQSGVTATYNTTETLSPDGTYNATKFIGNGSTGVYKASISVSGVVSRSVYLKSVSGTTTAVFKGPNTNLPTPITLTITNEWQRFELIGDNGSALQGLWIDDITSDGLYMWGAQLEQNSFATSYIPTSGEANGVTRLQDAAFGAGSSDLINSTEGVLYLDIAALADDLTNRFISLTDGTQNNSVCIFYGGGSSNFIRSEIKSNNVTQAELTTTSYPITNYNKIAISYAENNFALWVNGFEVATDTSGSTPIGLNNLSFNRANILTFFGKTKCVAVFKEALTDAELTCLTTI